MVLNTEPREAGQWAESIRWGGDQPLCRGERLFKLLAEVQEGVPPTGMLVGGFSESLNTCKRFAGSFHQQHERGPPAVVLTRTSAFKEDNPSAEKAHYRPSWLKRVEHRAILDAMQTLPDFPRSVKDKVASALTYEKEKEWFVHDQTAKIPDRSTIRVYVSDDELRHMGLLSGEPRWSSTEPKEFFETMDKAVGWIEARLPIGLPENLSIELQACTSTMNLFDDCESHCVPWAYVRKPEERERP